MSSYPVARIGPKATHGTPWTYNRGCRCVACKQAGSASRKRYPTTVRHRLASGEFKVYVYPPQVPVERRSLLSRLRRA